MNCPVTIAAHAKVNLHLEVLAPRGDGYHDIRTLVQAVDLADTIELRARGPAGSFRLRGRFPFPPEENLVSRAVAAWRAATGAAAGLEARVLKRIPIGGGFGGGSCDAAAVLRGLAALFPAEAAGLDAALLAAGLGSDVPFFLDGAAAVAEGRGERLRPVPARADYAIVAVSPAVAVRTADAYRWVDDDWAAGAARQSAALAAEELERQYREGRPEGWSFLNSFDGPVTARQPAVARVRAAMLAAGAPAARLTGSGSTVIAVFDAPAEAAACAERIAAHPPPGCRPSSVRLLRPLDSPPIVVYYG
jgi:4-diphosphocytidyl-2-C-methyl-D-erythritol kinase